MRRVLAVAALIAVGCMGAAAEGSAEDVPIDASHALTYAPGAGRPAEEPIRLGLGPHLFLDDYLIASSESVNRVVTPPVRDAEIPNPVVTGEEDGCFQPYMTILRDSESGRFRIWYGRRTDDSNGSRSRIGYMESEDGIHWERPARVLEDPDAIQFGVSVVDDGASVPAKRYKYGWYLDSGLRVATSPDGIAWTAMTAEPVVRHNHDINSIFFDPLREHYIATVSVYRTGEGFTGKRRITMQCTSEDLAQWTPPHHVLLPVDGADDGETQFYAMDGYLARGDLLIGMVKVLRDDLTADAPPSPADAYGVGYTALAWTRDGVTWVRDRAHFFDPNPAPGTWDHAHAWIDDQVLVGDEVYLYYGGYARGHKVERFKERQIGLVRMTRDRYVARASAGVPGRLVTPPVILEGSALSLNADASDGEIRVQMIGHDGKALEGFAADDCAPIRDDGVSLPVRWSRPLTEVGDRPVQIEVQLQDARVFGIGVE